MNRCPRALLAALALFVAVPLPAHEGHDQKDAQAQPPERATAPRAEASTPDFELVAALEGARLVVYLDRFATNEPVQNATIEIESAGRAVRLPEVAPGVYATETPWLTQPGRHLLVFAIEAARTADLLNSILDVPAPVATAAPRNRIDPWRIALAATALAVVGAFAWRFARRRRALAMLVVAALAVGASPAPAHQGEDHEAKGSAPRQGAAPARLGDGSVFVGKPSQRQLAIRTQLAEPAELSRTIELAGRIVPDPNAGGRVQASQAGRIEPGPKGLPLPGRSVARGEVLAYLHPAVSSMDRAGRNAALADIAGKKRLAEQQLERYRQLEGSIAQRRIDEVRLELESLTHGEAALAAGIDRREALVAPVAGVLSASHAVAGQVVEAKDVLYEIVDPKRLMVEALAYDANLAQQAAQASAQVGGATIALEFVGAGWQLRDQAVPLLFRVRQPAPALAVGQPLKILVATRERINAVRVPLSALSGGAEPMLWIHQDAERFAPRKVRVLPLDAGHAAVVAGLEKGERFVVQGAAALAQVR